MNENKTENIILRAGRPEDAEQLADLSMRVFGPEMSLSLDDMHNVLRVFADGQAVLEDDGKIIGSALGLIINFDEYGYDHSYDEISDINNHNPNGKNLYGIEVVVDPDYRGLKLGNRLYEARRNVARKYNLESIIFGGRIPNYYKYAEQYDPDTYGEKVMADEIFDPVMTFQKRNGFELLTIMKDYLEGDDESLGNAALMEWKNDQYDASKK